MSNTSNITGPQTLKQTKTNEGAEAAKTPVTAANTQGGAETQAQTKDKNNGLSIDRYFSKPGTHPYNELEWENRTASITSEKGEVIFEQKNVEVPAGWTQLATNVVVSKYFKGGLDTEHGRESSVKQLIDRVVRTITRWGLEQGYFASAADAENFEMDLTHLLVNQQAAFNSPVWFNVGIEDRPQCSACFINSVEDRMDSILELAKTEGLLFKWGSGTGTNFSPLRASKERLSTGGHASGPVSFMRGYDSFAGVIKSGGKTRRAAKMVILNADHPDIEEFIESKAHEEKKAWALIDMGYDGSFGGEAYNSVFFQNANHSVRVTDDFMKAVVEDKEWHTRSRTSGEIMSSHRARDLMRKIADGTHVCGDPGMQFDTTINDWHTCPASGRINASNPCSEYMFLDNSACNLASLNLLKFRKENGDFDHEAFSRGVQILITAQEILVDNASYPTPRIEKNSHKFRPLGLGYANLGALLMARGLPYDSEEGRDYAAAVTALLTGESYRQSAELARIKGPFEEFEKNRKPMLDVIQKHRAHVGHINPKRVSNGLLEAAREAWNQAYATGVDYGFRNAQVSVLAPTGTIGFMMDCDTTGIEPDIALIKYKKLVGGGLLKIVNNSVPLALDRLGYNAKQIETILDHIDKHETIEGAPGLKEEHLPVFDCAFKPRNGSRYIQYMGHLKMMAAVQPFISGAISKTVNLPESVSVEEIEQAYIEGWKLRLKAVAIYRENCKRTQPLSTSAEEKKHLTKKERAQALAEARPYRKRLPDERRSITHKFSIAGHDGYITAGMYEDGQPGEIFIVMAKEGSVISGLMDSFATSISLALQYGVPLKVLCDKFSHTRFEPAGITNNPEIRFAKSITDYIFRWLELKFLRVEEAQSESEKGEAPAVGDLTALNGTSEKKSIAASPAANLIEKEKLIFETQADSPPCHVCGEMMVRNGACYKCLNCGATSGCS